jgi:molybdopterin synthase sulfur carrier subunit
MSKIRVLFFATMRQAAGVKALEVEVPEQLNVQGLLDMLGRDYPALRAHLKTVLVAINREFAFADAIIPADSEVGLFPPVSGG